MLQIFSAVLFVFFYSTSFAENIIYKRDIKPKKEYNRTWKKQDEIDLTILYNVSSDNFIFLVKGPIDTSGIELNRRQSDQMIRLLEKFEKWYKKANRKKIKLKKVIGYFPVEATHWKINNTQLRRGKGGKVKVVFFSQSTNLHQLILIFPEFEDLKNSRSRHQVEHLYFDFDEAVSLKNALQKEAVKVFLNQHQLRKEMELEFQ